MSLHPLPRISYGRTALRNECAAPASRKFIQNFYSFGVDFYVHFTSGLYREVHHPMRGGER